MLSWPAGPESAAWQLGPGPRASSQPPPRVKGGHPVPWSLLDLMRHLQPTLMCEMPGGWVESIMREHLSVSTHPQPARVHCRR